MPINVKITVTWYLFCSLGPFDHRLIPMDIVLSMIVVENGMIREQTSAFRYVEIGRYGLRSIPARIQSFVP